MTAATMEARLGERMDRHYRSMAQLTGSLGSAQSAQIADVGRQIGELREEQAEDRRSIAVAVETATTAATIAATAIERAGRAESTASRAEASASHAVALAVSATAGQERMQGQIDALPSMMLLSVLLGIAIGGGMVSLGVWLF